MAVFMAQHRISATENVLSHSIHIHILQNRLSLYCASLIETICLILTVQILFNAIQLLLQVIPSLGAVLMLLYWRLCVRTKQMCLWTEMIRRNTTQEGQADKRGRVIMSSLQSRWVHYHKTLLHWGQRKANILLWSSWVAQEQSASVFCRDTTLSTALSIPTVTSTTGFCFTDPPVKMETKVVILISNY